MFSNFWILFFSPFALTNAAAIFPSGATGPIADVGYARYLGTHLSEYGLNAYYGIHYAAPPTLDRRWQPPVPIENCNSYARDKPINATSHGPQCMQMSPGWEPAVLDHLIPDGLSSPPSEDCLLLDVIVPEKPQSSSLPVLLQIHGGGYVEGSSGKFDGSLLTARSNGSIIFVSIQYRLGTLGFLGGSLISSNGTANAGLLDQRLAIRWVKKHISAFGGDPNKITIIGGSAGGGSVTAQLQLFGGSLNPPFRAAIADFPWWQTFHNSSIVERQVKSLLQTANCTSIACLRSIPFSNLSSIILETYKSDFDRGYFGPGDYYYGPSVDGKIIKGLPSDEFIGGRFSRVPLLVDHDALEGATFANISVQSNSDVEQSLQRLWPAATPSFFQQLRSLYDQAPQASYVQPIETFLNLTAGANSSASGFSLKPFDDVFLRLTKRGPLLYLAQAFADAFIGCSTRTLSAALTGHGVPIWKAIYNAGVLFHGAFEVALFSNLAVGPEQPQQDVLQDYILSFVRTLDPNAVDTIGGPNINATTRPFWPKYGSESNALELNYTGTYVARDPDNGPRCDFLGRQGSILRN